MIASTSPQWHFPRPALAEAYLASLNLGLSSARGLFARRRMGKTEFLVQDFMPAARAAGYTCAYVNLWELKNDPATALVSALHKAIEPDLDHRQNVAGTLLMAAMAEFDKSKKMVVLIIDEAQVLASADNAVFAHALRAALDIRRDRLKVLFAGSSETTLRRMFGRASEPFYNWAALEPFPLLGREFVESMVQKVTQISRAPLPLMDALAAFDALKQTPLFFRDYLDRYLTNPFDGPQGALDFTRAKVFNDGEFEKQWKDLLPADQFLLSLIAGGQSDLQGVTVRTALGASLGLEKPVTASAVQNALRRLADKNVVTRVDRGAYRFEDEAFAEWVQHQD